MGKSLSKEEKKKIDLSVFLSTCFFSGYSPFAPGTIGAVIAIPFYALIGKYPFYFFIFTLLITGISFPLTTKAEKVLGKDDGRINLDEFVGMLVSYLFLPLSLFSVISGFIFFRVFDIFKLPPVNYAESFKKSGVVVDDIVAGGMANIVTRLLMEVVKWHT